MPTIDRHPDFPRYRMNGIREAAVILGRPHAFSGRFGPAIDSSKWGGRASLGFHATDVSPDVGRESVTQRGRTEVVACEFVRRKLSGKRTGETHEFSTTADGGTEWQIVWPSLSDVPPEWYVDIRLAQTGGLTFHHQPALTADEVAQGCVRPESVVNSFAVYGPQSGRYLRADRTEIVNYGPGKYGHWMRSWVQGRDGVRHWCRHGIMADGVTLRTWLPRALIESQPGAWRFGPDFGYTTPGASWLDFSAAGRVECCGPWASAPAGTIDSFSGWYYPYNVGSGIFGLYDDSAGSPTTLVGDTPTFALKSDMTKETRAADGTFSMTGGATYWLAFGTSSLSTLYKYDSVDGFSTKLSTWSGSHLPSSPTWSAGLGTTKLSIYATYTAAASGPKFWTLPHRSRIFGGGIS